jgi:NADH-quinone oxidoreductase subunit L
VKEAPVAMLVPMIVLAGVCLLFGLGSALPIEKCIQPVLSKSVMEGSVVKHFAAILPHSSHSALLWALTVVALAVALGSHVYGVKRSGSGLGASEHWHHAPVLSRIYERAERRGFDPYDLARRPVKMLALIGWALDRLVDWANEGLTVGVAKIASFFIRAAHTGSYALYIGWSLAGALAVLWFLVRAG